MRYEIKTGETIHDVRVEALGGPFYEVSFQNRDHRVDVLEISENLYSMICDGQSYEVDITATGNIYSVLVKGMSYSVQILQPEERVLPVEQGEGIRPPLEEAILSPMTCTVVKVLVKAGEIVESGQELLMAEAMKLEMPISSPIRGKVKEVLAKEGQTVDTGTKLISLIPLEGDPRSQD